MAVLGGITTLTTLSLGGSTAKKADGPPINAGSSDEEKFIKYVAAHSPVITIWTWR